MLFRGYFIDGGVKTALAAFCAAFPYMRDCRRKC